MEDDKDFAERMRARRGAPPRTEQVRLDALTGQEAFVEVRDGVFWEPMSQWTQSYLGKVRDAFDRMEHDMFNRGVDYTTREEGMTRVLCALGALHKHNIVAPVNVALTAEQEGVQSTVQMEWAQCTGTGWEPRLLMRDCGLGIWTWHDRTGHTQSFYEQWATKEDIHERMLSTLPCGIRGDLEMSWPTP